MPPSPEALPDAYQPKAYSSDVTILRRLRFRPNPARWGNGPWPVAITLFAGGFKDGDIYGSQGQRWADNDLANQGFLVFSLDYRLAPPGLILMQHAHDQTPEGIASGRPPQQTNDVKQQILAAYYDSECNGTVFLIGGSSGASHSLWAALDPTPTVPGWPVAGVPKAIVSLSGVFDLSSREGDNQQALDQFVFDVRNYTNTTDPDTEEKLAYQYSVSPLSLVAAATNIPPLRLYSTEKDPVPHQQSEAMRDALVTHGGVDIMEWTVPASNLHSFQYWHTLNPNTGQYVSVEAISFLRSHLQ